MSLIFGKCSFLNSVGIDRVVGQSGSSTCCGRHEVQNDALDLRFISWPQGLGPGVCGQHNGPQGPGRPIRRPSSNSASERACRESSTWSWSGLSKIVRFSVSDDKEALHEAFAAAVEQWPREGMPANPRAWLISVLPVFILENPGSDAERQS